MAGLSLTAQSFTRTHRHTYHALVPFLHSLVTLAAEVRHTFAFFFFCARTLLTRSSGHSRELDALWRQSCRPMEASYTSVTTSFSLPTWPLPDIHTQAYVDLGPTARRTGVGEPAFVLSISEQTRFLRRLASHAWNAELKAGKSATDPGTCVIRYPPLLLSSRGTVTDDASQGWRSLTVSEGMTATVSCNGAVTVVCYHVTVEVALYLTRLVKHDLLTALSTKGPRGLVGEQEEADLYRYVFSDQDTGGDRDPLFSIRAITYGTLVDRAQAQWEHIASMDLHVRSLTSHLTPVLDEVADLRTQHVLREVPEVSSKNTTEGSSCQAATQDPSAADTLERVASEDGDGSVQELPLTEEDSARTERHPERPERMPWESTARDLGSAWRGLRINVRGDAGFLWLEALLRFPSDDDPDRTSKEAQMLRHLVSLCPVSTLLSQFRQSRRTSVRRGGQELEQDEAAFIVTNLTTYLAHVRSQLRDHVKTANVSRTGKRQGLQVVLHWLPGNARGAAATASSALTGPSRSALTARANTQRKRPRGEEPFDGELTRAAEEVAEHDDASTPASVASTAPPSGAYQTSSVDFFFMESTLPETGHSGHNGNGGGNADVPSTVNPRTAVIAGNMHSSATKDSLADMLKDTSGRASGTGTTLGAFLAGADARGDAPMPTAEVTGTPKPPGEVKPSEAKLQSHRSVKAEDVNVIIFPSGKAQFVSSSAETLWEVVQLVLLPFYACTGELFR